MWNILKEIRKFTPKAEVDRILGVSPVQIKNRPSWYYGGGFVLHYSPVRFRIEGIQRVEYGQPGEYAVGLYHFSDVEALRTELGLDAFPAEDAAPLEQGIDGGIAYGMTFHQLHRWACEAMPGDHREGETWRQVQGELTLLRRFIQCGPYELYFYGKSRRTKLTGFRYVFPEA